MKISVAVATYNGEKYVGELLESILRQTLPVDEVIIGDDRSSDNTEKIVREFIRVHSLEQTWEFSVNDSNLGFAANFRKIVDRCTGDLVFFCDQDDIWISDRVEKMVAAMQANCGIEVLFSRFIWFQGVPPEKFEQNEACVVKKVNFTVKNRHLAAPGCVMCVRKRFLDEIKPFWAFGWAHDDAVWNFAVVQGGLYGTDYVSLLRREHENRTSGHVGHGKVLRIAYLTSFSEKSRQMFDYCSLKGDRKKARVYQKSEKMALLRLKLVRERKLGELIRLLPYLKYYHKKRSYLMEAKIAVEND